MTPCISIWLIYVNIVDMSELLEDQPLGYLLSRVANALRAEVMETVLDPLGLAFPQYICMRVLSKFPGRSNADLARDTNVSPAGDEHGAAWTPGAGARHAPGQRGLG